jgi:hypothetical protein
MENHSITKIFFLVCFYFKKELKDASEEIRVKSKKTALASLLKIRSQNAFIQNLPKKIYSRINFVLLFLD